MHAAETAYDAYKAVDTVHDLSKAADVAITVSKKGDAVLDAADAAKDIRNADYLQDSLNRIVKAQHPNPKRDFLILMHLQPQKMADWYFLKIEVFLVLKHVKKLKIYLEKEK